MYVILGLTANTEAESSRPHSQNKTSQVGLVAQEQYVKEQLCVDLGLVQKEDEDH